MRGYDSHLIIEQIYSIYPNKDIQTIPNNYEQFMSFKIGELKFIDSFQFMASSIEKLTERFLMKMKNDKYNNFNNMRKYCPEHMDILCRKGVYP